MSDWHPEHALDQVALKWRSLAERRRAHLIELYKTGRWKRYYSEESFLRCMREAIRATERWADIAPRPADQVFAQQARAATEAATEAAPEMPQRSAA
jgi:uncharacterized repeat protein (TIGR03809 family)